MKVLFLFVAGLAMAPAKAQEIVNLQTRPGVTLPFFIANMDGRKPEAVALLLSGGGGNVNLRVTAEAKRRYPGVLVFVVGTSRSTLSAAYLAAALDGEVSGAVLTSSLFYTDARARFAALAGFDWSRVRMPLLLVHHEDDGCGATPYHEAARLGRRFPLVTVKGGKRPESGPCDPLAQHGFFGREAETVDAVAGWMLGKPFAKEIR